MSALRFTYESFATRVVFGAGAFESLAAEVARLGRRALVITSKGQFRLGDRAAVLLAGSAASPRCSRAVMHVPAEVAKAGVEDARAAGADCLVCIGGGSTTGLAKAIALETGLPILAVATTYAGSEVTPIWGVTEGGVKRTGRDLRVLPRTVLYDPELTVDLSAGESAASGMNAIAHCVEGLYSQAANPVISLMAEEGIRSLAQSLPRLMHEPSNIALRGEALYGAWLGGTVLGAVGMALHHKLCHVLGGAFNLPHAQTHAIVLPHAVAYNAAAAPDAMQRIARALGLSAGSNDAAQGLYALLRSLGIQHSLRELQMPQESIERAVQLTIESPYYNPAPIRADRIRILLRNAFEGRAPESFPGEEA